MPDSKIPFLHYRLPFLTVLLAALFFSLTAAQTVAQTQAQDSAQTQQPAQTQSQTPAPAPAPAPTPTATQTPTETQSPAQTAVPAQTPADAQATRKRIAVGLYKSPPFVMIDEDGVTTGMAYELWERIADELNLESDYTTYPSLKALVDATAESELGVAVTNLTITKKRAERMNFTQPWFDAGLRIMTSDGSGGGAGAVFEGLYSAGHLQTYAWMVLAVVIATLGITLFDRRFDPNYPQSWREGLADGFYTVMSVATSGKPPTRSKLFGWIGKVWAALWLVCGIAVLAYVTSSVTSVMTTIAITNTINSAEDLPGHTIGVFEGSISEEFADESGWDHLAYEGMDEAAAALKNGTVAAIVADAPVLEYYAHIHPDQGVEVVGPIFEPDKYGFALHLDNRLTKSITVVLLRLKEEGVVEDLREKYFGD